MEGVDQQIISQLSQTPKGQVRGVIRGEDPANKEITTSLLNLLYNIRVVGSIPTSQWQRTCFNRCQKTVDYLISDDVSIEAKKKRLETSPGLVHQICSACLLARGVSSNAFTSSKTSATPNSPTPPPE